MKTSITEFGLAVITAIVALSMVLFFATGFFTKGRLKEGMQAALADENERSVVQQDNGIEFAAVVTRKPPNITVQSEIEVPLGTTLDLLDYVSATNADGKDLTSQVICRINGEKIPSVYYPISAGIYDIEYYVVDNVDGQDYGKVGTAHTLITVVTE